MGCFIDLELEHTSFTWVSVKHLETIGDCNRNYINKNEFKWSFFLWNRISMCINYL